MNKILVVEDDIDISNMLKELLNQNNYYTTLAYSGTEALLCFKNDEFDLILLDLMLPGKSGDAVLAEIRKISSVPILVLTAVTDKETMVTLLKAGADDYIRKPFDNDELIARIETNIRRQNVPREDSKTIVFEDIVLIPERYDAMIGTEYVGLSKREYEILKILMEYPKKVFTKNNLYESVWKDEFLGDDNTINVHISKIRTKLSKHSPDTEYIQTVWGIGFKMRDHN